MGKIINILLKYIKIDKSMEKNTICGKEKYSK